MRGAFALFLLAILTMHCGSKKDPAPKTTEGTTTTGNDFTAQFPALALRYYIADTLLLPVGKQEKPMMITGMPHFPDSLLAGIFEKGEKPRFYALGQTSNNEKETYLVMKAVAGNKAAAFLLCYDSSRYKDGVLLCKTDDDPKTNQSAVIDKSFNIMIHAEQKGSGAALQISDRSLIYNNLGFLMEAVNNDPNQQLAIINPIDTLPQLKKYSGDYSTDKNNFISIRDGRDSTEFEFFYHFRKDGDGCEGEIKGTGTITGPGQARFMQDGDPCVINFAITASQITIKEDHGCGNYRGMDCKLDGVYPKRKKAAPVSDSAKKTTKPIPKKEVKTPLKKPADKKAPVKHSDIQ
jgi:hypothetical protein